MINLRKVAAISLLIGGAAMFVAGAHNWLIRSFGLMAIIGCILIGRKPSQSPKWGVVSKKMWFLAAASSLLVLVALVFLWLDAVNGYHEVLPVYAFAGAALLAGGIWSVLASQLF